MEKSVTDREMYDVNIETLEDFLPMMFHNWRKLPEMINSKHLPVCIVLIVPENNVSLYFEWDDFAEFFNAMQKISTDRNFKDHSELFSYFSELSTTFILSTFYKISRPNKNFVTFNVKIKPPKKEMTLN